MKALVRHRLLLANLSLVLVLFVGGGYLLVSVMRLNPLRSTYTVTVLLDASGGLQSGGDATMRGVRVGEVAKVDVVDAGNSIAAEIRIDTKYRIPVDTEVAVARLSAAGEQYLDFRPAHDAGPYLDDGAVVPFEPRRVHTPTPVWSLLDNASALITQLDPEKIGVILGELDTALSGGPDQLRHTVDGLSLAAAGLDNLLPQTTNLITNLRTIAATTKHAQPDLTTLTRNSGVLVDQLNRANAELRTVLDSAPGQLTELGAVLDRSADPITGLLTNLSAIVRAAQLRNSALRALFPSLALGGAALGVPAHDNEFHAIFDIWLRPYCQYRSTPIKPEVVQDGTLPKWNYCDFPPPGQQIRGAANAPRPDVPNNGANMPPGVDPNERTLPPVR
ncbi:MULTISPECIES: MlaD family protein [unclassified Nocardia]|uniref:MlaD family protein n=1 Tax=unclassified Nocardia TaxID=2637762 RepID=UPI001CE3C401|nr:MULTISPECIES: MlaD family protein [unclassified Nocardia]